MTTSREKAAAIPIPLIRYAGPLLGPFLGTYAFNSASVASVSIARDLSASAVQTEVVVAAFGIPFAVLLVLGGRVGDRVGRRRSFRLGMGLFAVASAAASAAPDVTALAVVRVLQGAGAALLTPQVLATIQATSQGKRRERGVMLFGAVAGIGLAAGQVWAGFLLGIAGVGLGWRLTFLTSAVVGLASLLLSIMMPASRSRRPADIDAVGTAGLAVVVLSLVTPLTFGPTWHWAWWNEVWFAVGLALALVLWRQQGRMEQRGRIPLLPPSVVGLPALRLGLLAVAVLFGGFGGMLFVLARTFEQGLDLSPLQSGTTLGPFAVGFVVASLSLRRVTNRLGHATSAFGFAAMTVLLVGAALTALLSWGPATPLSLQPWLVPLAVGQGLVFSPLVSLVLDQVPDEAAGLSGALLSTMQQLALALGVILVGSVSASVATGIGRGADGSELATALGLYALCSLIGLALVVTIRRRDTSPAGAADAP